MRGKLFARLALLTRERADGRSHKRTTCCGCCPEGRSGLCGRVADAAEEEEEEPQVTAGEEEEEEPQVKAVMPMPLVAVPPKAVLESTLGPLTTAAASLAANIVAQHLTMKELERRDRLRQAELERQKNDSEKEKEGAVDLQVVSLRDPHPPRHGRIGHVIQPCLTFGRELRQGSLLPAPRQRAHSVEAPAKSGSLFVR